MNKRNNILSNIAKRLFPDSSGCKTIAVLGMHRSGTSCLTGLLEESGVYLGNVSKKNPYNLKGNQESFHIMSLHDSVLADNNVTWDNPPKGPVAWNFCRKRELKNIIKKYKGEKIWAFKDPRTLYMLERWLDLIPTLKYIGTFRHPVLVAQSLYKRGGMPQDEAFNLWACYNERLLMYKDKFDFGIINFNLAPDAYLDSVKKAIQKLGIIHSSPKFQFFDLSLRHSKIDNTVKLPPNINNIYQKLLRASL